MRQRRWCGKVSRQSASCTTSSRSCTRSFRSRAAAALKGEDVWAAQILRARHAVTEATGATIVDRSVNELRQETERAVRARLGDERWARAHAAGRKSTIESLMGTSTARRR
jgi:hypothetical protein